MAHLESSFDVMDLTELLQWLHHSQKNGRCRLRNGPATRTLYCRDGHIVACTSNEPHLLLGQFLMYQGRIDEATLRKGMTQQDLTGRPLGEILVGAGVISEEELDRRVTAKAEETILGLFDWDAAQFRFDPDIAPPGNAMRVDLDVNGLMFEGMRRADECASLRRIFPSDAVVLHTTDRPPSSETVASHIGQTLYRAINGRRTIGELILLSRAPRLHAYAFLARLVDVGVLRIGETRSEAPLPPMSRSPNDELRTLVERGAFVRAVDLVESCDLSADGHDETAMNVARAEAGFLTEAFRTVTPPDAVPRLVGDQGVPGSDDRISEHESFLLQLIDGQWEVRSLVWIVPLRKVETVRALMRLIERGLVTMAPRDETEQAPASAEPIRPEDVDVTLDERFGPETAAPDPRG